MKEMEPPALIRTENPVYKWVAWWTAGLLASLLIHECTSLDFVVQNIVYSQSTGNWWVSSRDMLPRVVFYLLPKWFMITFTIALGLWVVYDRLRKRHQTRQWYARLVLFLSLILTPLIVGLIKHYSGVWCPSELTQYGGDHTFRLLFQLHPLDEQVGHCFPAGHASAGFAFLALYYLPAAQKQRLKFAAVGMTMGWVMGLYQMFKGAHFLSHTTTTMCIAGLIAVCVARGVRLTEGGSSL